MDQSGLSVKDLEADDWQKQPRLRSPEPQAPVDAGHDPQAAQELGHPGRPMLIAEVPAAG